MIVQVIIIGLAGWRVAAMLSYERGPYDVFGRVRRAAGIRPRTELGEVAQAIKCPWCLSVWTVAVMWGLWHLHPAIPGAFAAMAVAVAIEQWVRPPTA